MPRELNHDKAKCYALELCMEVPGAKDWEKNLARCYLEAHAEVKSEGSGFADWLRGEKAMIGSMLATVGLDAVVAMLAEVAERGDWREDRPWDL